MKASIFSLSLASLATCTFAAPGAIWKKQDTTPVVDLGYEQHSATLNSTGDYYLFSNIPYAQQPIGDLRFQKPVAPTGTNTTVNAGATDVMCIQGYPGWYMDIEAEAAGVDTAIVSELLYSEAGQTESCLMLDVYVPTSVYENASNATVMFWIHGGGFVMGSKTSNGSPAGWIAESGNDVIVVAINYRLGLFGWLSGGDITPNLGLYDQALAFAWVQQYISLFGGDASKVTAIGESAGASSILHHITAYGGKQAAPFDKAIIMSPAFQFNLNLTYVQELTMTTASSEIGVETIEAFSDMSSAQLQQVNQAVIAQAISSTYVYGVAVDGTFVPDHPQVLLLEGSFDASVNVLAQHMANESVLAVPSTVTTTAALRAYAELEIPEASNDTLNYMFDVLYPDVLDGTYPWTTEFSRTVKIVNELEFACSTRYLSVALGNNTYNSIFSYPPGYHAQDVPYLFFNGDTTTSDDGLPVDPVLAADMQTYFTTFAKTGNPNYDGGVTWPMYGADANVLEFSYSGPVTGTDDMKNSRCDWFQQAMAEGLI